MDGRREMVVLLWLVFASLSTTTVKPQIAEEKSPATQNLGNYVYIDCGVMEDYTDETTGLYYQSDQNFVSTGKSADISPEYNNSPGRNFSRLSKTLRYFPEGRKNCYTIKPEEGKNNNYMIRAYLIYGNYDGKNQTPKFDLYLGVNYWLTIDFAYAAPGDWVFFTAVHFSPSNAIFMCLVNTGLGIPTISALELKAISNSIYRTDSGFAQFIRQYDVGSPMNSLSRYKDDVYDRIWRGYMTEDWVLVNTSLHVNGSDDPYNLPSDVLSRAAQPRGNLTSLSYSERFFPPWYPCKVYFHFAELQKLPQGLKRQFTITLNDGIASGPITPQYLKQSTIVFDNVQLFGGLIQFSINSTVDSDLPPILNSFEFLVEGYGNASATSPSDVDAIMAIKQIYKIDKPDWQGDPCVPINFLWNGLRCNVYNHTPRITYLDLGSSALSGAIASELSTLQELQFLDLSNNNLTGTVPAFLAELPNLVTLNLSGNRLTGPLPWPLVEKSKNGKLNLSFDQTSDSGSKNNKRDFLIPLVVSVISFLVLLNIVALAIYGRVKRHGVTRTRRTASLLKSKNLYFTYDEIANMTFNFANIVGEGGFGKVYLGELSDGTLVAVKLLSESSKQGIKEFLSEMQLLMMVHHRNLVPLIGYCDDDRNMALVYEYMENGNLKEHLSEKRANVLNWRERLQIAVDAGQGLEYLHNGCKPPIVHRDLKTSNILLNENMVAKISDFGLSRVYATDKDTHISTNPAGTFGYVDPEFYVTGNLNKKSDVYSFGIILLELITGQPVAIRGEGDDYITHIIQWITPIVASGDIHSIVDSILEGEFNSNSAWKLVEIAMSCIPTTAAQRPDMDHVLLELKECLAMDMALGGSQRLSSVSSITRSSNGLQMSFADIGAQVQPRVR